VFLKATITSLGHQLDFGKHGSASLYYCAEVMCSLFYFAFYRLLFEAVESFWQFAALQVLHVAAEWFNYGFMASKYWFLLIDRLPGWLRSFLVMRGASNREWQCYVTNAFGIRITVFIYTSIAFILFKSFVVFGWNSEQFGEEDDYDKKENYDKKEKNFLRLALFVAGSGVIEAINAWLMNIFFFAPSKLPLGIFMSSLHRHGRPYEFEGLVIVLTNNLLCNVFVPFVSLEFADEHAGSTAIDVWSIIHLLLMVVLAGRAFWLIFQGKTTRGNSTEGAGVQMPEKRQKRLTGRFGV